MKRTQQISETLRCPKCNGLAYIENPAYRGALQRKMREDAGLSLREVARRMDYTASYLSDLEHGQRSWSVALVVDYNEALVLKKDS